MEPKSNNPINGLTEAEVRERMQRGKVNAVKETTSRSYAEIIRSNVFTLFNAILGALLVVILLFGSIRDALFGLVLVANTLIGTIQEVRAKWTLDRLSLLSAPKARVIRDGKSFEIAMSDVVLDDVLELRPGDQIVVDGIVLHSQNLEVDESLLTGESLPVTKAPGDTVLSGSFVVAGTGLIKANRVGTDAYARKLAAEARYFSPVRSELQNGINTILRYVTWIIIPTSLVLLVSQLQAHISFSAAVTGSAAGIIGMIPQGLVLLTSAAFAVSIISLGHRNVLVQQLPAVEVLARVDVLCLDKTGTITEGILSFSRLELLDNGNDEACQALGALAAEAAYQNPTLGAIAAAIPAPGGWQEVGSVSFSSARKWSGASFTGHGTWLLGAPEVLLSGANVDESVLNRVNALAGTGLRVLLLAKSSEALEDEKLPDNIKPVALVVLEEKVRPDAAATLRYFDDQGVAIKIISGDNPSTVATVASRAGLNNIGEPVDARQLPSDIAELARVLNERVIFGRVTPQQKQQMVKALQSKGHVVGMTGDGVNDVLALKDADLGIAMGSGAPATKSVAEIVLLDGKFSTLPGVVAEGRRVIANIERVANLFLTKTVYVTLITIAIALLLWPFPFLPRQLTLIDAITIGIPAFVLSFAPSKQRYRPGFINRVLHFAIPIGLTVGLTALISYTLARLSPGLSTAQMQTAATLTLIILGLWVLTIVVRPLTFWRAMLVASMVAALAVVLIVPAIRTFLALEFPSTQVLYQISAGIIAAGFLMEVEWRLVGEWIKQKSPS
ncbi:MAG TPA: HAD-IC family P-type ATPase [Candidatus Aquicultor sp.]|jgi:cation-transporting ATPase E